MTVLAVDIPIVGPILGPITDAAGGLAGKAGGAAFGFVVDAILGALANACRRVVEELIAFLGRSSSVNFDSGWWAGERGQALFGTVLRLSAVLLLVFLLLAVLQGLLAGEPAAMLRAAAVEAPLSVLGTVGLVAVTTVLLGVVDEASSLVLADAPSNLGRFATGFGTAGALLTNGLLAAVFAVVFLLGAMLVWIELAVRASLVYFLVLLGPIALSARVWPAARGVFRKLCELGVAIIVSKFAIALALALGAASLAGGGPGDAGAGAGEAVGGQLSGLLTGATLMLLASFTPFVVLRLVPVVEGAMVAHGISRSPLRGAMATAQGVYYGQGLARLAGAGRAVAGSTSGAFGLAAGGGGGVTGSPGAGSNGPNPGPSSAGKAAGTSPRRPPPEGTAPMSPRPAPPVGTGNGARP
jgi:hypothetical protein